MNQTLHDFSRRDFLQKSVLATAGLLTTGPLGVLAAPAAKKRRVAMVGTGHRGTGMWGTQLLKEHGDVIEFVGLCDSNKGRLETAKKMMGVSCPTFTDFELMMRRQKPDILLVTTVDSTHDEFIIKGMEMGADIVSEKPMTTDETKCQAILDAEKRTGKKVTVTFNYRYSPHRQKIYDLIRQGAIGTVTSVDFHWYLDNRHGADYFRRWHRLTEKSGSLWVHKASHHFDLLNWWLQSEPETVYAKGALENYGKNGPFRFSNCRPCPHKAQCPYYWDLTKDARLMALYAANEQHDGYLRDGCVYKEDVNIYDKMAATIGYANGVQVSYSLTAYSPYEGYRIAFNGTKGRIDAWIKESGAMKMEPYDEIMLARNFGPVEYIQVPQAEGHGGGDVLLRERIFRTPDAPDTWRQAAGSRDGAMAILVGIGARKSIASGQPVRIADLTTLRPQAVKA
ncbi:Gfo/Idh/MocA family protein [Hymenobacter psychrotolerans]|uniref:Oxidoreductase family, C-terminal alpha/beta domain n=1 Tax=Hymenobacter psychrotolerans DSM 18569 TaxID=1121959 RepID=A0A1M7DG97_9BACT|nr:Gfo/Idh/MocA family oxidoreductase [Hymenobacter psychrotolerans]SHL78428.1 Oxidoreductase family, C-terminal alpha/beta domain [Hymenobacter psychrotolerans DSM 18569]